RVRLRCIGGRQGRRWRTDVRSYSCDSPPSPAVAAVRRVGLDACSHHTDDPAATAELAVPPGEDDGAVVPGGRRAAVPGGRGAAVPGGRGAVVPGGRRAAVPSGRGAVVPGGRRADVPSGRGAVVPGGRRADVPSGRGAV